MRTRSLPGTIAFAALLLSGVRPLLSQVAPAAQETQVTQPSPAILEAEESTESERALVRDVRTDLVSEKFDDLDRLADGFRREKARWPTGAWKLRTFYEALDAPHQTDKDTVEHLDHLKNWMKLRPQSVTARIALATSLHRWAWVARGNGTAEKVTSEGWELFGQRIAEAQAVLDGSRDMKLMDPQWYSSEMTVGLAQGWDARKMKELFDRAVQFEPDYQYFYKARANYLLPKWYGESNDATDFARSAADKLGGDRGDMMYFVIATVILKRGNGNITPFVHAMDWNRIQRGYQFLSTQYTVSGPFRNALAFMAYKYNDAGTAQRQFASIGNDWAHSVWKDRGFFDKVRDWSTGHTQWP